MEVKVAMEIKLEALVMVRYKVTPFGCNIYSAPCRWEHITPTKW